MILLLKNKCNLNDGNTETLLTAFKKIGLLLGSKSFTLTLTPSLTLVPLRAEMVGTLNQILGSEGFTMWLIGVGVVG